MIVNMEDNHEKRMTVKFICSRATANELVRHRVFSFTQESTRFVNYKTKGLSFVLNDNDKNNNEILEFLQKAENTYCKLIDTYPPEMARIVLPLCTKTELCMTGTIEQWKEMIKLRTGKEAHPEVRKLLEPISNNL